MRDADHGVGGGASGGVGHLAAVESAQQRLLRLVRNERHDACLQALRGQHGVVDAYFGVDDGVADAVDVVLLGGRGWHGAGEA